MLRSQDLQVFQNQQKRLFLGCVCVCVGDVELAGILCGGRIGGGGSRWQHRMLHVSVVHSFLGMNG